MQNKVVKAALDGKMPVYSYNGGTFDADDLTSPAIHLIDGGERICRHHAVGECCLLLEVLNPHNTFSLYIMGMIESI